MNPWTKREIEELVVLTLDGVRIHELARRLRRASTTVRAMQLELELIDPAKVRKRWKQSEIEIVRTRYADTSASALAKELGRPVFSVYNLAEKLGISKSPEYLASPAACRLRRGDGVGKNHRFKPGTVPPNKGLRRPGYAPGRMAETQFKPGASLNKMALGSTRLIDGYLYRKISEIPKVPSARNWRLEHYLVWEAVNGPVPEGHALVFRDRDRSNIALENLELITRAELARRNSIHQLPEDLKEVIRLNSQIKRRIRKLNGKKQDAGSQEPSLRDARSA